MCHGAFQFWGQTVFCGEILSAVRRIYVLWGDSLWYEFRFYFCGVSLLDLRSVCVLWGKSVSSWNVCVSGCKSVYCGRVFVISLCGLHSCVMNYVLWGFLCSLESLCTLVEACVLWVEFMFCG